MQKTELLTRIAAVRRDLGSMLFHFTRSSPQEGGKPPRKAYDNLQSILREGRIRGFGNSIMGGHKCVCFTEAPITEMAALFNLARISSPDEPKPPYEPYGVAVTKKWLFERGGRPVIYQPPAEYELLPNQLQYRHVSYDPCGGPDVTWEREWRIQTDTLALDHEQCLVIVPEAAEAFYITYEHADLEVDSYSNEGEPEHATHFASWLCVSLDFFGLT